MSPLVVGLLVFGSVWALVLIVGSRPMTLRSEYVGFAAGFAIAWVFLSFETVRTSYLEPPHMETRLLSPAYLFWTLLPVIAAFVSYARDGRLVAWKATLYAGVLATAAAAAVAGGAPPRVPGVVFVSVIACLLGRLGTYAVRRLSSLRTKDDQGEPPNSGIEQAARSAGGSRE